MIFLCLKRDKKNCSHEQRMASVKRNTHLFGCFFFTKLLTYSLIILPGSMLKIPPTSLSQQRNWEASWTFLWPKVLHFIGNSLPCVWEVVGVCFISVCCIHKYHRLCGFHREVFLTTLEARSLKSRHQQGSSFWGPSPRLVDATFPLCHHIGFPLYVSASYFLLLPLGMASFYLNYLF